MFFIITLLFCIFFVAVRINQIVQQNYKESKERNNAINAIIYDNYHNIVDKAEYDDSSNYNYTHADLEQLDETTDTEEINRTSNVISLLKEKNARKHRK